MAGVGGKTVAEARANLSYKEARQWLAYIQEHGSIAPQRIYDRLLDKLEYTSAKICWAVWKAQGAKRVEIEWFIPKKPEPENQEPGDIQSVFKLLKSVAKKV